MMSADFPDLLAEPERYELANQPTYHFDLHRREFFKVLGCGVVVLLLADAALAQEGGRRRGGGRGAPRPAAISAWLHIAEDGTITAFTGKTEVGQNIRTSLAQAVSEELRAPIGSIRMVMADTDVTPFDAGTFGSRTTPDMAVQLRRVSAAAREALLDLAAERFQIDRAMLDVSEGKISRRDTNAGVSFGELTKGQKLTKSVTDQTPLTSPQQWKTIGASIAKVDGRDFVTGKHKFSSDISLPGMLHGKVLRPPAFGATLVSADSRAAEMMDGVHVVRDGNFLGVVAPDTLTAARAIEAIKSEWNRTPQPSSAELFKLLKPAPAAPAEQNAAAATQPSSAAPANGAGEEQRVERTYTIAYIAHAPLEPRAAVAQWKDDKVTIWTGTQRPFGVRGDVARAFGIPEDRVRVIVPDTGSGYGGKHTNDAAIEAARLAKSAGKPVKLVWTREEEFTWAYFRPAGVIDVASSVSADGTITSWDFHNYNSGRSAVRSPYDVPSQRSEYHEGRSPLKQGSYRALASTANIFAREMHMDELARRVKMDPLAFRLHNLKEPRLRAVLETASSAFGWGKGKANARTGHGLGCGTEKGSYVAACAEISANKETGAVRVIRVVVAFECGAIVNPDHLKSQIEGCIVMGLGGALFEAIAFENGIIKNARFSQYRVPRFSDTPRIEVVLLDRKDLPSAGAGETPIVCIAPAVGNAICDATGIRLTSLPMIPNGLRG